jgi:hypothetical protein
VKRVLLVGCGSKKAAEARPARDLYTGTLFRARRLHAEASGLPWAILTARLPGLLALDQVIEPYDRRLDSLDRDHLAQWRHLVRMEVVDLFGGERSRDENGYTRIALPVLEVHAGRVYLEALRAAFGPQREIALGLPEGLSIGQQLAWYAGQRRAAASEPAQLGLWGEG